MARSTRRSYLQQVGALSGSLAAGLLSGCRANGGVGTAVAEVRVGGKPFAEQRILGYLAFHRLAGVEGIQEVNEIGYGDSIELWEATAAGTKDLYWEYTGTAWLRIHPRREERLTDPESLYERVRDDAEAAGLRMGTPAPFSNEWVLVADTEWSDRTGITTISGLVSHVEAGTTDLPMAVGEDFYHREDGWQGLTDHYGMNASAVTALESGSFVVTSIGLTYELLSSGRATVATGFNTDPHLADDRIVVLDDDRDFFLPYQPAPTVHAATVSEYPAVLSVLEPVAASLDEPTMRESSSGSSTATSM